MAVRIDLHNVTLCSASDVAIPATLQSMSQCLKDVKFHDAIFFSSKLITPENYPEINHISVQPLQKKEDYSRFILTDLAQYIETDFVLIVQWDGFITNPRAWKPEFLDFDYIGAPWLEFPAHMNVGNGGFSLRSKRLLDAGSQPWFEAFHPEDLCICHGNREALEARGFRIADLNTAQFFSRERTPSHDSHFGTHGIFALADIMSLADFEEFLGRVERGVIGKRELVDTLSALEQKGITKGYAVQRCASEFLRRHPFDRMSLRMVRHLVC